VTQPYYPSIDDALLVPFRALQQQLVKTPDLLTRAECPYPPAIRAELTQLLQAPAPEAMDLDLEDIDTLEGEISQLYRNVKAFSAGMAQSKDKDAINLYKTLTSLLEKIMEMRGSVLNMKNMSDFQRRVLEVLDNIVTPEQRAEFIEKLGSFAEGLPHDR
jgi:hypothetical protein